ncbi:hypothetical protein CDAR_535171 [Caerostris darwini]|uniref:C2H2-type domain-containing protein n=1 Tax=Caerostris darwini TaxID=1538125 RepID=A0AAV4QLV5_9ARAC|nr:hypothetical protein CDAR_535171 [Caerostris darwini]
MASYETEYDSSGDKIPDFSNAFHLDFENSAIHSFDESLQCKVCFKVLSSRQRIKMHLLTHSEVRDSYKCVVCGRKFGWRDSLIRHLKIKHADLNLNLQSLCCGICNRTCKTKQRLLTHIETHYEVRRVYSCKICDQTFTRPDNLKRHIKIAHFL